MDGYSCRVCGSEQRGSIHLAREMMFGTRDEFQYDECASCRSLQIQDIPSEEALAAYYPNNYYAFGATTSPSNGNFLKDRVSRWALKQRDRAEIGKGRLIGRLLKAVKPSVLMGILRATELKPEHRLLDVGCGAGHLLDRLANIGFVNGLGADLFIPSDISTRAGVSIKKMDLHEIEGRFDLIMFNHSFEHVRSPREQLERAHGKLRPDGRCLIRMPTPSSEARETYGVDWAQWDAPRHLTLISRQGMGILAEQCGFSVVRVIDDSMGWSWLASELYRRGIPLRDPRANLEFPRRAAVAFEGKARSANAAKRGDSAAFILARKPTPEPTGPADSRRWAS